MKRTADFPPVLSPLIIRKLRGRSNKYLLDSPLTFTKGDITVTVPEMFLTDLSTFWLEGRHTEAAVIHDYLLLSGHSREFADKTMYEVMLHTGVRPWYAKSIYLAITVFGKLKNAFNK